MIGWTLAKKSITPKTENAERPVDFAAELAADGREWRGAER